MTGWRLRDRFARTSSGSPLPNDFEDEDNNDSIILTWETWQRRFGTRGDVMGERVWLGSARAGERYRKTIVGVLEPEFRFEGEPPEILLPVGISAAASRRYSTGGFRVVAAYRAAPHRSRRKRWRIRVSGT